MNDWVEIGVFATAEEGFIGKQLYLQKHRIRSGKQRISVVVPNKPASAGIDPNNLLIDTNPYDNTKMVKVKESVSLFGAIQPQPQGGLMHYVVGSYL